MIYDIPTLIKEAEEKLFLQKGIPVMLGFQAGHCGKCGAPYFQDNHTGAYRPLCCCWNLIKITYSDSTNIKRESRQDEPPFKEKI